MLRPPPPPPLLEQDHRQQDLRRHLQDRKQHCHIMIIWGKKDQAVPYTPGFGRWKRALEASGCHAEVADMHCFPDAAHGVFEEKQKE